MQLSASSKRPITGGRQLNRQGMAMIVTLMLTVALGALALSAVYLASGTKIGSGLSNRAADLQYAADAALQIGKSYVNADPNAMPATGYREITFNGGVLKDASGNALPGVSVKVWVGPTGATTGQFGAFGSVIAQATDQTGAKVVRRLELAQENFARFAYWSNRESNSGSPIWFGGGDVIFGPTWSNDTVHIYSKGSLPFAAQFRDDFGTAKVIVAPDQADFWKGYTQNGKPITMPAPAALANMPAYAASGFMNFVAGSSGDETTLRTRIEFVNIDIDNDGSNTDPQDGFMKIYDLNAAASPLWVRGDQEANAADPTNRTALCGEWININGADRFFSVAAHTNISVKSWLDGINVALAGTFGFQSGGTLNAAKIQSILTRDGTKGANNRSQCFLGGASQLNVGVAAPFGGTDSTFKSADANGSWRLYPGAVDPRVLAKRPAEAAYLFPLYRGVNSGARGVINVTGTVGVSGLLVGRVTLHSTGSIVILDDIKYGTNPAVTGRCVDILGLLSDKDVVVADNMLNNQADVTIGTGVALRLLDDSKDLTIHAVIMALGTSFRVQNYASGPTSGDPCVATDKGRGCLALLGGLIQDARGAVGTTSGTGYLKQYTYDRCANLRPPPYFPTTGRYLDNRYMEVDPVTFNIATLMARLTP